jgi:signal transduction histidine kinase
MPTSKDAWPEFLSLAVHELRTPAGVVGGYLRMLLNDKTAPLSDHQRKMIGEAEKSCERLVALIAEMSEVSKLDAGSIKLGHDPLDLFTMVEEVAKTVHEAEDRKVRLDVRGTPDGATMTGDGPRLRQALSAVFRAILREQAGPCTVVVDRRLDDRSAGGSAIIVVAEEGAVQSAYASAPAAFDDMRGGLGLALPLARRVIEGHLGRLSSPAGAVERGAAIITFARPELDR